MKCLILAGGRGERLWPLSRKNNPKQFIQVQKNHSVFQETVARNIPYCDEFIIVTNYEYRYIIEIQMKAFQGTPYRCVFEEEPRKTTAAIILACMDLQPSEYVFVVAADHLIDTSTESQGKNLGYKDAILKAKEYAGKGLIVTFGETLGMLLFQNGTIQNELTLLDRDMMSQCRQAYQRRNVESSHVFYSKEVQQLIHSVSIKKSLIEKSKNIKTIPIGFQWNDIGSLEDLSLTELESNGVNVENNCSDTVIINQSAKQAVVVNELDHVLVVNTVDAVYIGKYGKSGLLKEILHEHGDLEPFAKKGLTCYRTWGYYEQLVEKANYRIRTVVIFPGKTIYEHKHLRRSENWTLVRGQALITLDGIKGWYHVKDNIDIPTGVSHQISNIGEEPVVFVETAVGEILHGGDMVSEPVADIDETQLGYTIEPMVKLRPAFKDYLWGGTKLRDIYNKDCDYDAVAESWELSAHPAGQSTVASGKHQGMKFGDYLAAIGKEALGWKCSPLQNFPLLIKFIDAKENLSVQVHPDDDYALENENEYGKNEMWYVIDSEPDAGLYVGFNQEVSREEVEQRILDNTILDILNYYPTKPGDVFFIPAGTVHAIGAGNLICEIQQSSNCTYRLYDYNRKDKFGNRRELHLQKALDVMNYNKYEPKPSQIGVHTSKTVLSRCKYFEVTVYEVGDEEKIMLDDDRFYSVVCIKGIGKLQIGSGGMPIQAGESFFIPAVKEVLKVTGKLSIVISHI